jgi:hypothetical protein
MPFKFFGPTGQKTRPGRRFCEFITPGAKGRLRQSSTPKGPFSPDRTASGGQHAQASFDHEHRRCRAWRALCERVGVAGIRKIRISNLPDPGFCAGRRRCPGKLTNPGAYACRDAGLSASSGGVDATPEIDRAGGRCKVEPSWFVSAVTRSRPWLSWLARCCLGSGTGAPSETIGQTRPIAGMKLFLLYHRWMRACHMASCCCPAPTHRDLR